MKRLILAILLCATTVFGATTQPRENQISGKGTGVDNWLATPSSANLATAITDETGSGALVFGTSPRITTDIKDTNGNTIIGFTPTTSADDYVRITNDTSVPTISSDGADTNINLNFDTKGTGRIVVKGRGITASANAQTFASSGGNSANTLLVSPGTYTLTGTTTEPALLFTNFSSPDITDASAITVTEAATVYIANAPNALGSVTITRPYALWVDSGTVRFDAGLTVGGTAAPATGVINASTGYTINGVALAATDLANMATDSILGRSTTGTGPPEVLSALPFAATGEVTRPADSNVQTIDKTISPTWTGAHTWAVTSSSDTPIILKATDTTSGNRVLLKLDKESSTTPANGDGPAIQFTGQDSTTATQIMGQISLNWTDVTHATKATKMVFYPIVAGSTLVNKASLYTSGGFSVGSTVAGNPDSSADPGVGVINAGVGFKVNGTEFPIASNGFVTRTAANTYGATTAPAGTVVGTTDTQTLTNKRITKRVLDVNVPSSPVTPDSDSYDGITYRAIGAALTLNAPSGTPTSMQPFMFRFKDDGTGRALTFTTGSLGFRAIVVAFPTTTVANKTTYLLCTWNGTDSRWDSLATGTEP